MTKKSNESTDASRTIFLGAFVNNILIGSLVLVVFGLPSSLMRWSDTGFMPIYAVHIFITVVTILMIVFHRLISLNIKGSIITFNLVVVGLVNKRTSINP